MKADREKSNWGWGVHISFLGSQISQGPEVLGIKDVEKRIKIPMVLDF